MCMENKREILRFHDYIVALGIGLARQIKYLETLYLIANKMGKPFSLLTKDDILGYVKWLENSSLSDWTKHDYKLIFKIFYKWLKNCLTYPDEVAWIRTRISGKVILPEELISKEEVEKLVQAAYTARDRALILLLYESGCRIGEVLSLRIKSVSFDQYGAQLIVNGKTGSRRVRIAASAPALSTWLDNHPGRDNPDSPVWISTGSTNWGQPLTYPSVLSMLKKLKSRAGLAKRIYPHLFRHTRATFLAKHVPEPIMKEAMGWVQSSGEELPILFVR